MKLPQRLFADEALNVLLDSLKVIQVGGKKKWIKYFFFNNEYF